MERCCICQKDLLNDESIFLFEKNNIKKNCCNQCKNLIDIYNQEPNNIKYRQQLEDYFIYSNGIEKDYIASLIQKNTMKNNVTSLTNADNSNIFWTNFLHTISMINLICGVIIGLYLWWYYEDLLGFFIGIIFVLLTLISTSAIMVFVEMSKNIEESKKDIAKNRQNTDKLLEMLNKK